MLHIPPTTIIKIPPCTGPLPSGSFLDNMQRFVQLSHHEMWQGTHRDQRARWTECRMERFGLKEKGQCWEPKNCPKLPHACADDLRGEGDDDSGAGTFYFTHLHFPGPSFEIDQCILVLGHEPQIICYMQQMQIWSNISCHRKLVFCA